MDRAAASAVIVAIVVGFLLFAPVSPTIFLTFTISTKPSNTYLRPYNATINFISGSYQRVALIRSFAVGNDNISLVVSGPITGQYNLTMDVRYGSFFVSPIATRLFQGVGDGLYEFRITLYYNWETANLPYVVGAHLRGQTIYPIDLYFLIYPS